MGSEVVKGCEGAARITIMVLLVVALGLSCVGFGLVGGIPEEEQNLGTIIHIALFALSLIFLIGLSTWYILIFKNKVKYGPKVRKGDGIFVLVVGVLVLVVANICAGLAFFGASFSRGIDGRCSGDNKCDKGTKPAYLTVCGIALASLDIALLLGTILGCTLICCGGDGGAGQPSNAAQQSGGIQHQSGGDAPPPYAYPPPQYGAGQPTNYSSIQPSQPI